jgi:hypothetical protein
MVPEWSISMESKRYFSWMADFFRLMVVFVASIDGIQGGSCFLAACRTSSSFRSSGLLCAGEENKVRAKILSRDKVNYVNHMPRNSAGKCCTNHEISTWRTTRANDNNTMLQDSEQVKRREKKVDPKFAPSIEAEGWLGTVFGGNDHGCSVWYKKSNNAEPGRSLPQKEKTKKCHIYK